MKNNGQDSKYSSCMFCFGHGKYADALIIVVIICVGKDLIIGIFFSYKKVVME